MHYTDKTFLQRLVHTKMRPINIFLPLHRCMFANVCTSLWKSNRNVFFRIKFDRDYLTSIDCVWCVSKDLLKKLKSAKYLSMVITRGRVMKHWKKYAVNFAISSSVTALWRRWVSLTKKMHSFTQITFDFTNRWIKGVVWWFSDIILHKWYFHKLWTIK